MQVDRFFPLETRIAKSLIDSTTPKLRIAEQWKFVKVLTRGTSSILGETCRVCLYYIRYSGAVQYQPEVATAHQQPLPFYFSSFWNGVQLNSISQLQQPRPLIRWMDTCLGERAGRHVIRALQGTGGTVVCELKAIDRSIVDQEVEIQNGPVP